jgi:hypothetical protein
MIQTQKTDGQKRKTDRQTHRQTNNKPSKRQKMQNMFYKELIKSAHNDLKHKGKVTERQK